MSVEPRLVNEAKDILRSKEEVEFPKKLQDSDFYLTDMDDDSINAVGLLFLYNLPYKIGVQKNKK